MPAQREDFRVARGPDGFVTGDRFGGAREVAPGFPPTLDREDSLAFAIPAFEAGEVRGANLFDESGGQTVVTSGPIRAGAGAIDQGEPVL
jgi:hypothetical protein